MKIALCGLIVATLCACTDHRFQGVMPSDGICVKGHEEVASGNWGATSLFVCDDWRRSDKSASGETE